MKWDDYRVLLAVSRAKGLPGAAERLGVTLSTVFRRLESIENELGVRLFDRTKGHYEPSETARDMILAAERMEQEALSAERALTGRDQQLEGNLQITGSEVLASCFLARHVPAFREEYPGLLVNVISDNFRLNLANREADIALRPMRPTEEVLVARKIADIYWGVYASPKARRNLGEVSDVASLRGTDFVAWEGTPSADQIMANLFEGTPNVNVVCASSSLLTNAALAASGLACVCLPCMLGFSWPNLDAVLAPVDSWAGELWVTCHQDLHRNARVRAMFDHLIDAASADRLLSRDIHNRS